MLDQRHHDIVLQVSPTLIAICAVAISGMVVGAMIGASILWLAE
jgi:hypothetical protein